MLNRMLTLEQVLKVLLNSRPLVIVSQGPENLIEDVAVKDFSVYAPLFFQESDLPHSPGDLFRLITNCYREEDEETVREIVLLTWQLNKVISEFSVFSSLIEEAKIRDEIKGDLYLILLNLIFHKAYSLLYSLEAEELSSIHPLPSPPKEGK